MKKLLALLLTLTMSLGLLAGCGQQTAPAEEAETAAVTETEEAAEAEETTEPAEGEDADASADGLEKVVITDGLRGYYWAPAYLAESLGYYEQEGLDVEFQTVKGSDATAPVLAGDAQFTLKGIETALMVNEAGQGMKVLASFTQKYPYSFMGASGQYPTLGSLRGKVVGGGMSVNSGPYSFTMACMNYAGLVPEQDVSVITMASAGYAAAIANDEIQGVVATNPWSAKKLTEAGAVTIVDGTDDQTIEKIIGSSSYELFTLMTSDAFIQSNPETVQKTVNAVVRAMKWMQKASPEEITRALSPLFDGAEEELLYDAQYDEEHAMSNYTGYHSESGFQAGISLTKLADGISQDYNPSPEEIFDESFLDNAWASLGQ